MKFNMKSLTPVLAGAALLGAVAWGGTCLWKNRARVKSALNISGAIPTLSDSQVSLLAANDVVVKLGKYDAMDAHWLQKAKGLIGTEAAMATINAGYFFASA